MDVNLRLAPWLIPNSLIVQTSSERVVQPSKHGFERNYAYQTDVNSQAVLNENSIINALECVNPWSKEESARMEIDPCSFYLFFKKKKVLGSSFFKFLFRNTSSARSNSHWPSLPVCSFAVRQSIAHSVLWSERDKNWRRHLIKLLLVAFAASLFCRSHSRTASLAAFYPFHLFNSPLKQWS